MMRGLAIGLLLAVLIVPARVQADTAEDLVAAKRSFDQAKEFVTGQINEYESDRRKAIWTQYYGALEALHRMEVHYRMITYHHMNRQAQFATAQAEFRQSLKKLADLLSRE